MDDDEFIVRHFDEVRPNEGKPIRKAKLPIRRKFKHIKNSKTLCVIFPPWHGKFEYDKVLRKKILTNGMSCLEYEFPGYILSTDPDLTKTYFNTIKKRVSQHIHDLSQKHRFTDCHFFASSLGCVSAVMTASHNPMVSKLVLQVPANSLVSSLWDGIRSRNFKKKFLEMGITKKKLRKFWKTLEPENNVDGLLGKEVHVVLSKQDRVVPYKYGRKLVSILRKMPVKLSVKTHKKSGHYITVLEELLFSNDF